MRSPDEQQIPPDCDTARDRSVDSSGYSAHPIQTNGVRAVAVLTSRESGEARQRGQSESGEFKPWSDGGQSMERRRRFRCSVHWGVSLSGQDHQTVRSVTENLSSAGFFCYCTVPFQVGEPLDCLIEMATPGLGDRSNSLRLRCQATVVRVEPDETSGKYGIACQIEDYTVGGGG
jgi:PilZ domain-containing protein